MFDDRVLHEVRLKINPKDWQSLKDHFRENTYYPAIFEWRGLVANDVGIRSRGQGSRSPVKPNLRVDFNHYDETGSFLGLTVLQLKANNQDPSLLKERLSMLMFLRMGLPASREVYTRLYVNGQYAGLYMIVEEINKEFLTRNFAENEGYLYEWNLPDEPYRFEYMGPDLGKYVPLPWEPKTHENSPQPAPLEAMVRNINQASDADFPRAAAEYLDLKLFATHVAIENYISEFDGILGELYGMNNFYFYRFKGKNLSQFIVWDKDRAFADGDRNIFQGINGNVLSRRALQIPEVRTAYLEACVPPTSKRWPGVRCWPGTPGAGWSRKRVGCTT
ncbi:MAG: CotH kinase family protein [Acidobacteria bacterium]|nr:CotH kinase family protein [Acidobacteriota bacterium]